MTDTTNDPPRVPKPNEGSGVCLTPDQPDKSAEKRSSEGSAKDAGDRK